MAEYLTNTTDLTKVASAIREKGGTSDQLVYPDGFVTAIQAIQTGGGTKPGAPGDITFYDYDGTIVTSWTLEELAAKTALPDYPSHEGLTCQGWNWSLADLKTTNRKINVGAMYITDDGKTRIYIRLEEGRTSPMLGVCPNGTVTVDWGDGTTPDTLTGASTTTIKWTPNHAYAAPGEYVIKLTVDGTMGFYGNFSSSGCSAILRYSSSDDNRNRVYRNSVQKIEIGNGVTSIGDFAFDSCYSLTSITIPDSVTSIGDYAFGSCYSLTSITIPDGVTSIGNYEFANCYSLSSITIPDGVTSIGDYAFSRCSSIESITIPDSVTSIRGNAFRDCSSIESITIPDSVTSIGGSAFRNCSSLASITIPDGVTSIGNYEFANCYSLSSITIPDGVTSIGDSAFESCYSLASITMPDGVTSIGEFAFGSCYSLASITIHDGVTSIGGYAFDSCYCAAFYDFTACTTVPALASTTVFNEIYDDCKIRVPAALVDEWKAATNWSTYADHIVGV